MWFRYIECESRRTEVGVAGKQAAAATTRVRDNKDKVSYRRVCHREWIVGAQFPPWPT